MNSILTRTSVVSIRAHLSGTSLCIDHDRLCYVGMLHAFHVSSSRELPEKNSQLCESALCFVHFIYFFSWITRKGNMFALCSGLSEQRLL